MHDGFVVLNSDVLFHPRLLRRLLASTHPDALLLDYRSKSMDPMGDEEMKVQVKAGRVVDISKELDPQGADGENVGIVKFSSKGAETLIRCMDRLIQEGRVREWAPRAFLEFTGERDLYVIGTDGDPWIEIDFPEDFEKALADIYPKIEANQ
jgi:choline kinase